MWFPAWSFSQLSCISFLSIRSSSSQPRDSESTSKTQGINSKFQAYLRRRRNRQSDEVQNERTRQGEGERERDKDGERETNSNRKRERESERKRERKREREQSSFRLPGHAANRELHPLPACYLEMPSERYLRRLIACTSTPRVHKHRAALQAEHTPRVVCRPVWWACTLQKKTGAKKNHARLGPFNV